MYSKSIGRAETPTLAMIVSIDGEINIFVKEKYYIIDVDLDGFTLSTDSIDDKSIAKRLPNSIGDHIEIKEVIQKKKLQILNLLLI